LAGSHTLEKFINDVARDIEDPETKLTVWKRNQLRAVATARTSEARDEARRRADLRIGALGSGSDYTPFLQHVGIASLNLGYGGVFSASNDPRERLVPPAKKAIPPYLNFAELDNAVDALTRAADRYDKALAKAESNGGAALAKPEAKALNATLLQSKRALTIADGLPRRPWYRHQVYAPGFYTGS